jgi:hypothetical protein
MMALPSRKQIAPAEQGGATATVAGVAQLVGRLIRGPIPSAHHRRSIAPVRHTEVVCSPSSRSKVGVTCAPFRLKGNGIDAAYAHTWASLRLRYGLDADSFDPQKNMLAGARLSAGAA